MPEWARRYLQPREGWLAAALLMVMLLSLCWAVQRAEWLEQAEFLVPVAFYALLLGAILGLTTLSVVAVLPISAVVGGAIVLWAVGGEYFPGMSQAARFLTLRSEGIDWARILTDQGYAPQLSPYALALGLLMWSTAFIAAYTMYRHHRVLDAILLVGAALVANLSATLTNLFIYIVIFMLAALLLWLRAALIGREEGWQRRRVNENTEVPAAIMRSGLVFIATSIVMASVLTTVAVAAPLTAVWNNLDTVWTDARGQLDLWFGGLNNADSRFTGTSFGPSFSISGEWTSRDDPVLTVAATLPLYMRARTYDVWKGRGWEQSQRRSREVATEQPIFPEESAERPTVNDAFRKQRIEVQIQRPSARQLFTTGYPISISAPVIVTETNGQPFLGSVDAATSIPAGSSYFLTAAMSNATRTQLSAAGTNYPQEILDSYLGLEGVTDRTRDLAEQIEAQSRDKDPYSLAEAIVNYFRVNDEFDYQTVAPLPTDPDRDLVDYFLFDPDGGKVGYCEHFASSMVVLARSLGIPARLAVGYAPGQRLEAIRSTQGGPPITLWQVRERNAHAWPELYFPGYGWERFEPTKGVAPIRRANGDPLPPASPGGPTASTPPRIDEGLPDDEFALPSSQPLPGGVLPGEEPTDPNQGNGGLLLVIGIVGTLLIVAVWRWQQTRRALRFLAPGDRQWRRLAMAADRAGVAQRPSETIYEYAGWLEEQIPSHQPDIRTIANGKVWQSYSGHGISGAAIAGMEAAWKRLQLPLLWLALKRRAKGLIPSR
ncbi:MAG TPA: transglutaminaseTgpA domain-containing protein [Candidatus Limnocylindria bacterium]|nr:transglutaminaseTgpA domain-containing protein [Candidatus Limnocylindria bacterium]